MVITPRPRLLVCLCALLAVAATAEAQTFTYNGPFTATGATANPWSTDTWIGGVPTSGTTTQLIFRNFDTNAYSANNDLGNPFQVNGVTLLSFSQANTTISSATGNSIQLTGANPTVTMNGPGTFTFGTGGNGLVLNPTSGTTTFGGNGAGIVTTGNNTITGTGGLVINNTGAGGVSLFGANTFTGGVTLNAGSLTLGSAGSLGAAANVLTINGGTMRTLISTTVANSIVLNKDLTFTAGTLTLNGPISGSGGLHLFNGVNFAFQTLTLGGASTFAGPITIDNTTARAYNPTNAATLTLGAGASLTSTQPITIGNNGTLSLVGNAANTRVPDAAPIILNGGRISVTGASGGNFSETLGNVTASGLSVVTLATAATNTSLSFGTLTQQNHGALFIRGAWNGTTNILTFAGGVTNVSDPLAPSTTGQYTGVVPFASGNNLAANVNAATRVTYDPVAGVSYISPLDSTRVYQLSSAEAFTAATTDYKNANTTGDAVVNDARRVNSLSSTAVGTISGSGTLTVSSGAVYPVQGPGNAVVFNGPTLDFGAATGYIHLGGNLSVSGSSAITGSGGVVISGLDNVFTTANGSGAGYSVQFDNVANQFTGGLFINGNAGLNFTNDKQLGAGGGSITFGGGGLTFNAATSTLTTPRSIILGAAGGSLSVVSGSTFNLTGTISGSGALTIGSGATGTGVVSVSGSNTYTGPTYLISGATLSVASDANLGSTAAPLNVNGGSLQFAASSTFAKPLNFFAGGVSVDTGANSVTLTAPLSGTVPAGFNKVGSGTLVLAASSPLYAGQVLVNAGSLVLGAANTLPQVTTLTVNNGATLAGTGTVGGSVIVAAGGTFSPGRNGPGQVTVGNNLNLASGSIVSLAPASFGGGGATEQVFVGGQLTIGGNLNLTAAPGFTLALNQKFFVIDSTGLTSPSGTFANGTGSGGLVFTDNLGDTYQINYADRDPSDPSNALSNDISLTVTGVVPEPSTWALVSGALVALALGRRARNRRRA